MKISLFIRDSRIQELAKLRVMLKLQETRELFENAICLLEWVVKEIQQGRIICSLDEEKQVYKELQMPIFSNIERSQEDYEK